MNKSLIGSFVGFLLGTAGGIIAGYFYGKNKYLNMAEKEIESVKKVYEKHFSEKSIQNENKDIEEVPSVKKPIPAPLVDPDKETYKNYAGMYGGNPEKPKIGTVETTIKSEKPHKKPVKTPYVITPDEYQLSDYESETLIWYSDKILADADGNIIHNINEVVGPEALSTFGRYLDDTVYVRDDSKKIDYEIIWDARKYSSVNKLDGDNTLSEEDESTD